MAILVHRGPAVAGPSRGVPRAGNPRMCRITLFAVVKVATTCMLAPAFIIPATDVRRWCRCLPSCQWRLVKWGTVVAGGVWEPSEPWTVRVPGACCGGMVILVHRGIDLALPVNASLYRRGSVIDQSRSLRASASLRN